MQRIHFKQCKALCEKTKRVLEGYLVQRFGKVEIGQSGKGFVGAADTKSHSSVDQTFGDIEIGKEGNGMIGWVDEQSLQAFVRSEPEQTGKRSATKEDENAPLSSELMITKQPQNPQGNEGRAIPIQVRMTGSVAVVEQSHVEDGDEAECFPSNALEDQDNGSKSLCAA